MIHRAGVGVVSRDCPRRIDLLGEGALGRAGSVERGDGAVSISKEAVIREAGVRVNPVIAPAGLMLKGKVDVEPVGSNGVKVWLCAESGTAITNAATNTRDRSEQTFRMESTSIFYFVLGCETR